MPVRLDLPSFNLPSFNLPDLTFLPRSLRGIACASPLDSGEGSDPRSSRRAALAFAAALLLALALPAAAKDAPKGKDDDDDAKGGSQGEDGQGKDDRGKNTKGQVGGAKDAGSKDSGSKDAEKSDDDDDNETQAEKAADRFPQPVVVGTLLRRTVLQPEESKPVLGHIADIVRARDGTLDAVVNYGGFFGFDTRPIAVPIDAMALLGEYMEILDFTPEQLKAFPTFDPGGTTPVPHSETIRVALAKPAH